MNTIHVWAQSVSGNPGGIQTFTRFVVEALRQLYPDAEILVFAKNDRDGKVDVDREGAINNTRGGCDPRAGAKNDRAPSSALPAPRYSVIGFGGWPGPLRAVAFALGVIRHAVRIRQLPDDLPPLIISTHANFAPVGRLVKRLANVSFAVVGHGIEVWSIHKASVRDGLRHADQLIAVSEFTGTRMAAALGVSDERIEILPNTFDSSKFQPGPKSASLLQRYGLTADQPVILTVARLAETEQYKGYDNVLLALPAVLQRFPSVRYVIVGDGPDRKRIEALSQHLRVRDKVILAGYVPNDELSGHYNLCDLFVMPSKGEGFGIVFLEALSCGKPVIAGNKDASAEAILNGKLGVMVDPDSIADIGNAICRVLAAARGQRSAVSGRRTEDRGQRTEDSDQRSAVSGQRSDKDKELITDNRQPQLDPELLRREVIAAYGFERFRERLGEIVEKLKGKTGE